MHMCKGTRHIDMHMCVAHVCAHTCKHPCLPLFHNPTAGTHASVPGCGQSPWLVVSGHGVQGCLDRAGLHKGRSMGMPGGTCVTREGALVSGTKMGKHTLCVGRCSLRPLYDPPSSTFSEAPAVVGSSSAEGLGQCPALPEYNLLVTLNIIFNYINSEHIHFKDSKCHIHG